MATQQGNTLMNEPLLQVSNLAANYGRRRVLHGFDLEISSGEWFSLLGPNGSGKSTLLRCVSGQLTPTAGAVLLATHALDTVLNYSSRAALLLDGRLTRTWDRVELDAMRTGNAAALEVALAEAATVGAS
jgi:ABC-type branched-subunit amino acid transport system ATPase component